ncbi:TPA: hypothetical protein ACGJN3_000718 [Klebsiella aerogenes]|nr:hypothetical protein [Klebsiella aerogenes]
MTDITELAQSMKRRAISSNEFGGRMYVKADDVLAQVEALEKAQTGEKQWSEVVDAFCADDADWHKLTNSTNELISLLSQALCKQADRIAKLESRAVTVKLTERQNLKSQAMTARSSIVLAGMLAGRLIKRR